jgi:hypothetical protein
MSPTQPYNLFILNSSYPTLAVLDLTGYGLSIINYWAIINSITIDFISAANLSPACQNFNADRLGNANGAINTQFSCWISAPTFSYFNGAGPFTITMWLYSIGTGQRGIMDFSLSYWDDVLLSSASTTFCSSGTSFGFTIYQSYSGTSACVSPNLAANTWTHVAVTYSTGSMCVYLNAVGGCYTGGGMNSYARNINYFGYNTWGQYGNYMMDEIKFHGRVLTSTEITSDMNYGQSYITLV